MTGFKQPRQAIEYTREVTLAYVLNQDLSVSKVDQALQQIISKLAAPTL